MLAAIAIIGAGVLMAGLIWGAVRYSRRKNRRRPPVGVDGTGMPLDDEELAAFTGILRASGIDDRVYDSRQAA